MTFVAFGALLDFAPAAMLVDPELWLAFVLDAILQLQQTINNSLGIGFARRLQAIRERAHEPRV